jgi:DNA-binding NarL/FixJ family response regulator
MQNLLLKLGVHSQLEAVAFAVEHGVCGSVRDAGLGTP